MMLLTDYGKTRRARRKITKGLSLDFTEDDEQSIDQSSDSREGRVDTELVNR